MCGRYGLYRAPTALAKRLRARFPGAERFAPHYNIAPSTNVLAITNVMQREVREFRWGLEVPAPGRRAGRRSTFNARIETIATSPLYGPLLPHHRCIVIADGYYEWPRKPNGETAPVWIFRRDGTALAFAGLCDGAAVTIITQPPNATVAKVHDRMPVALDLAAADAWLASERLESEAAVALLATGNLDDPSGWAYHRVGPEIGNVRNDAPALIQPFIPADHEREQLALFETG